MSKYFPKILSNSLGSYIFFLLYLLVQPLTAVEGLTLWKDEIKPLLEDNCWKCHGADKVRAELVLTTREGVLQGRRSRTGCGLGQSFRKPNASNGIL